MRSLNVTLIMLSVASSACLGPPPIDDTESAAQAVTLNCATDPRVTLGLVSAQICQGSELFFRGTFGGNGRSCGTCHPPQHNFTIDADFIATLPANDPLFVAENVPALAELERPNLMRQFGLILENLDGLDAPTTKFVMRSVPHTLGLSTSVVTLCPPTDGTTCPPNQRTGWSGDGAPGLGTLRDFQTGAITQHYTKSLSRVSGTDFVLATSPELDAIVAFMGTIGRTNDIPIASVSLTDAGSEAGRIRFQDADARCNGCHRNAGANNGAGINRNFDTGVETARIAGIGTPIDGGFGIAAGPGGALGNGTFNTPPLIEAADTGPWFHTNAFGPQIEDAIFFYTTAAFAGSPSGAGVAIPLSFTDIQNIGRFLRVLNAAMNIQLAMARVSGLVVIIDDQKNHNRDLQHDLARLALVEVKDALQILLPGQNKPSQDAMRDARELLQCAATHASHVHRLSCAQDSLSLLSSANAGLGTGMAFTMGAGSMMF